MPPHGPHTLASLHIDIKCEVCRLLHALDVRISAREAASVGASLVMYIPSGAAALAEHLRYSQLYAFDRELNKLDRVYSFTSSPHQVVSECDDERQLIVAERGPLLFVFNFSPTIDHEELKARPRQCISLCLCVVVVLWDVLCWGFVGFVVL